MEGWLSAALATDVVVRDPLERRCEGQIVEWVALVDPVKNFAGCEQVVFDWGRLNAALRKEDREAVTPESMSRTIREAVTSDGQVVTAVGVASPWALSPLNEEAQSSSCFFVSGERYRFIRGPPGQVSSRNAAFFLMESVARQFRQQNIRVVPFLSNFVIVTNGFDEALRHTGSVHKALASSGFRIDGASSSFIPRAAQRFPPQDFWSTLDTAGLPDSDETMLFLADAFAQFKFDEYFWSCNADAMKVSSPSAQENYISKLRNSPLFPRALKETPVEKLRGRMGEIARTCSPNGPRNWSCLELRLFNAFACSS